MALQGYRRGLHITGLQGTSLKKVPLFSHVGLYLRIAWPANTKNPMVGSHAGVEIWLLRSVFEQQDLTVWPTPRDKRLTGRVGIVRAQRRGAANKEFDYLIIVVYVPPNVRPGDEKRQ